MDDFDSPLSLMGTELPMDVPTTDAATSDQVIVELGERRYHIELTTGIDRATAARSLVDALRAAVGDCTHIVIIADEAVSDRIATPIRLAIEEASIRATLLGVASGEGSKSFSEFDRLSQAMLASATDRRSVVMAVGGGVVGDLAGFVAATFTRGLRFVQVPTTLLAMVDSSVGGKTGINLPGGKNLVGSFWQPHLVWVDTANLATLPQREYLSGLAEVIKYGVIEDAVFFDWLLNHVDDLLHRDPTAIRHAVASSCHCKARVVADDERETSGRRAILNYGHTFAHAIEATAGYGHFLHGEAVAIGMQMAASLATSLGLCDESIMSRQTEFLDRVGLPVTWSDADAELMLPVMARDKKVAHGRLRFVLPTRIGHVELMGDIDPDDVVNAIHSCR